MESVGFKEWAIVCEALGRGAQSVILRKGGIAEGEEGFSFRHREFFLFPTWFHEQPAKVRKVDIEFPEAKANTIDIKYFAKVESVHLITSLETAEKLAPFHILRPEVVRERFRYDQAPGLHVAFVRVFRIIPVWTIPDEKKFGGCRSWVDLPGPPIDLRLDSVLGDAQFAALRNQLIDLLEPLSLPLEKTDPA